MMTFIMFASGLITFRETLEVALVLGIVLTFLTKTNQFSFKKYAWLGVGSGVVLSVVLAIVLKQLFGGFEGRTEKIFEGILMFATAGFLTWMILWVHRQKGVVKQLQTKVRKHVEQGFPLGLFFLLLSSTLREGVETVFYLQAVSSITTGNQFIGAIGGMIVAAVLGYAIFRFSLKVNISRLLKVSGAVLLLFAAGLVAHGVHEFQEATLLPIFSFDPLINLSHILDHKSVVGSVLRTLFGYTSKPTMLELISYSSYIFLIFILEIITDKFLYRKEVLLKRN